MKILAISGSLRKGSFNTQLLKTVAEFVDQGTSIEVFDLSVMRGKPTGVISSSMSTIGGARAQVHLRDVLLATLTPVYLAPDFALASAHTAFDENGRLVDEGTRDFLQKYMTGYTQWVANQRA